MLIAAVFLAATVVCAADSTTTVDTASGQSPEVVPTGVCDLWMVHHAGLVAPAGLSMQCRSGN